MSKHLGNVLEPMSLMDQHGADAVRWFMLAAGSPWSARRVGHELISEVVRKTLLTYWNTVSFQTLYARAANFTPPSDGSLPQSNNLMDRWIISELHKLIDGVDLALANFDSQECGRLLAEFIDQLSNWYVRRSRRRFWDGEPEALATLHYALENLTLLMAPMVPFITDHVWQNLIRPVRPGLPESVHLADFPIAKRSLIDAKLSSQVALTRRLVELGRAARAESAIKIRQPLSRALISAVGWQDLPVELRDQISDELNVISLDDLSSSGDLVDITIKANFRTLGSRYGSAVQSIAKEIAASDAALLVATLRKTHSYSVTYQVEAGITTAEITLDDLVVTETPRQGWTYASGHGESVALDLELTPQLIAQGIAREAVRLIQDERKARDFDISDRITVKWNCEEEYASALAEHAARISEEVLAVEMVRDTSLSPAENELGLALDLKKSGALHSAT